MVFILKMTYVIILEQQHFEKLATSGGNDR